MWLLYISLLAILLMIQMRADTEEGTHGGLEPRQLLPDGSDGPAEPWLPLPPDPDSCSCHDHDDGGCGCEDTVTSTVRYVLTSRLINTITTTVQLACTDWIIVTSVTTSTGPTSTTTIINSSTSGSTFLVTSISTITSSTLTTLTSTTTSTSTSTAYTWTVRCHRHSRGCCRHQHHECGPFVTRTITV